MLYSEKEESGTTERRYILENEYLGHEDLGRDIETYQEYSAFGERIVSEGAFSRLGYNSQTEDELTGLTYLRARYYNPATGRLTQEDVIYDDGFNLYAYCDSNPVIYCDPSGFARLKCEYKAGNKTARGREYSKHAAERANERGFDSQIIDSIIDNNYKSRVKEIDKLTGQITWRYQDKRGNT
uniref:RHS repeat-associated core domain-containing protein n=1 Tax=Syphacia muris TaxID=451379 RepID=A0A0N5AC99_9BILA